MLRIFGAWEKKQARHHRRHLGASQIGRECEREVWFGFRWFKAPSWSGRMLRLFARGKLEEATIAADLRAAGIEFHDVDPSTGHQFEFSDFGGHMGGSMDGCGQGFPEAPSAWHVCEFKTHNDKSFAALENEGVKASKPEHYDQMQLYMGWSGMDRAMYLAVNKNTDEIYTERIEFDRKHFERLRQKAQSIIFSNDPPAKLNDSPAFYKCKMCQFHDVCHEGAIPDKNCRTCRHAVALEDGTWGCKALQKILSVEDQEAGCDKHEYIAGFLPESIAKAQAEFGGIVNSIERKKFDLF